MRAFVEIRKAMITNEIILRKIDDLIERVDSHDEEIEVIIKTIEIMLLMEPGKTKKIDFWMVWIIILHSLISILTFR